MTIYEVVKDSGDIELIDTVSEFADYSDENELPSGETEIYPQHLTTDQIRDMKSEKTLIEGILRLDPDNYYDATVSTDSLDNDVLIRGIDNRNRALAGDRVVVELLPKNEWEVSTEKFCDIDIQEDADEGEQLKVKEKKAERIPTGIVVSVIKRNSFRNYSGSLDPSSFVESSTTVLFDSTDLRLPKVAINLCFPHSLVNQRIVIHIDSWPRYSKYPIGHYVKTLGEIGNKSVEAEAILIQHGIAYQAFSAAVNACLPSLPWEITEDDLSRRRDLRSKRIFSIDPPGCTDIDDALSIEQLPNGNYSLGVHIADVSHFVKEGSAMDYEATRRANTVYLVDRRIEMLPSLLSSDLCSLKPRVDRFAFSVMWEITPDANTVKVEFFKSIIKSVEAFTYAQAQARIDDKSLNDPVTNDLRELLGLSKILRHRRIEKGGLCLSSPQVKFIREEREENQEIVDVELYEMKETNSLVEEFMLLANIDVAKEILRFFPGFSLLRRHPPPKMKQFQALIDYVKQTGTDLKIDSSKSLSESLELAQREDDPYFNELVRILTTRCLTPALYFSSGTLPYSQFYHYGLACPIYTHFTSPIRRYADVVVHRLLAAAIGSSPLPQSLTKDNIQQVCNEINRKGRMADIAARDSTRLHTLIFFKNKILYETGRVIQVRANGFTVLVPRYGIEGKVNLATSQIKTTWEYDVQQKRVYSKDHSINVRIFDEVKVQITLDESRTQAPKVIFLCYEPPIHQVENTTEEGVVAQSNADIDLNLTMDDENVENVNMDDENAEPEQGEETKNIADSYLEKKRRKKFLKRKALAAQIKKRKSKRKKKD